MMNDSLWYKDVVFYEVNVRAFYDSNGDGYGDLRGLMSKLDYLKELGVDCLWLLPIYPSPLKDDGYDIADYYNIHPDYGTLDDFKALLDAAHQRDMRVITDLVLNHTSDQHPWFQAARKDKNSVYREYYVWSDSDQMFSEARIIFLDSVESNWTWDEEAGQYYWHRFYASQPDLNFDNPAVQDEILKVIAFWLDLGVDGFRADAVPYLIEREGTNCENLPETHAYLKKIREYLNENYPDRILLAEANQWPEEVLPYFGDGTDEFHMGFHFPVMPRLFMSIRKGDRSALQWILDHTPPIPETNQWCIFLRNHDELTLEMVTPEEREWLWKEYAPEPRMRLNQGIRRRLAPLLDNDRRKIELLNSMLFTLPGSPIIYYGDEIGMGDNIWLEDRNGVRTPMQWNQSMNAGFSRNETTYAPLIDDDVYGYHRVNVETQMQTPGSLWQTIKGMISVRKGEPAFSRGDFEWLDCNTRAVAGYVRNLGGERLIILNNLSDQVQTISCGMHGQNLIDLLHRDTPSFQKGQIEFQLQPYEYRWLKVQALWELLY
ncbi:MAG: maltose alpha-D-glucosyltransferase [Anaerolineales bacterium]|nr:maltose alpha-D-glucosyltransferase [Anaerolineales bacterium]